MKEEDTKFIATINKEGRVSVKISGPHVNKRTFNRMALATHKAYRQHIKEYRKQVKRDMKQPELNALVAEPVNLDVNANGRVLKPDEPVCEELASALDTITEVKSPITKPISKVVECKKLNLSEMIEAKRAKALELAETK